MKTVIIVLLVVYIIHMHDDFKRALEQHKRRTNRTFNEYDHTNKEDVFKRLISKPTLNDEDKLAGYRTAFDNPKSKNHVIFHGGCIGCLSPEEMGIGNCIGCKYFTADWKLPNLYTPKDDVYES